MVKLDPLAAIQKTGDLRSSTFAQIWITIRHLYKYTDATLSKSADISTIQFAVLFALVENAGAMRASEIAQWISTQRHNITTLIRRMEKSGLVTIKRNEGKKYVQVYITDDGKSLFEKTKPIAKEAIDTIMSYYSDDELIQIQSMCSMMSASIDRAKSKISK